MTVTLEVGPETLAQARQAAQAEGVSLEQYLSEMVEDSFAYDTAMAELEAGGGTKPLADVLAEIAAERQQEEAHGAL